MTAVVVHDASTHISCREGSTMSQLAAPIRRNADATRNETVHENRVASHGVKKAVSAAPIWLPMFMNPDTDPAEVPAISAVTDQKEL